MGAHLFHGLFSLYYGVHDLNFGNLDRSVPRPFEIIVKSIARSW